MDEVVIVARALINMEILRWFPHLHHFSFTQYKYGVEVPTDVPIFQSALCCGGISAAKRWRGRARRRPKQFGKAPAK